MKTSTIALLLVAGTIAAGVIGMLGPQLVQNAFAQSASSTGASTDLGSASSGAAANFLNGGSTSSSSAGRTATCDTSGTTPRSTCTATR